MDAAFFYLILFIIFVFEEIIVTACEN